MLKAALELAQLALDDQVIEPAQQELFDDQKMAEMNQLKYQAQTVLDGVNNGWVKFARARKLEQAAYLAEKK